MSEEPWQDAVGQVEACDWCGRPGTTRRHDFYKDGHLVCRNPALCEVCFTMWNDPGEVYDAFEEYGIDLSTAIEEPMEKEFRRRWREKVAKSLRQAE